MADDKRKDEGLLATARRLARAAVTRAVERLTGLPLSGDPWATPRRALGDRGEAPVGPRSPAAPVAAPAAPVAAPAKASASVAAQAKPAAPVAAPAEPTPQAAPQPRPRAPVPKPAPPPTVARPAPPKPTAAPLAAVPHAPLPRPPEPTSMLDLTEPPHTYGVDEVFVTARDPGTLFVWWEVTPWAWDRARAELGGDGRLTLRFWIDSVRAGHGGSYVVDEPVDWDHGRRYRPAPEPDATVAVAIGLVGSDGRFAFMARGNRVKIPAVAGTGAGPVEWMEVEPVGGPGAPVGRPHIVARGPARQLAGVGPGRWQGGTWVVGAAPGAATVGVDGQTPLTDADRADASASAARLGSSPAGASLPASRSW